MKYAVKFLVACTVLYAGLMACSTCATCDQKRMQADLVCHTNYGYGSANIGFDCTTETYSGCGIVKNAGHCTDPYGGATLPIPIPEELNAL